MKASAKLTVWDRLEMVWLFLMAAAMVLAALAVALWLAVQLGSSIDCELRPHTDRCVMVSAKPPVLNLLEPRP